tara:strand:+ start:748 stop:1107 length:360 start_codon:yes stop_codon:yes gene_type:complete
MIHFILIFIIFIILSTSIIVLFVSDFWMIIINSLLLYIVLLRSYFEVRHKKILLPYLISLIITTLIFVFLLDYIVPPLLLWQVWFVTIMFLLAELIIYSIFLDKKYEVTKKIKEKFKKK